jgi:uncharacterized membrane protein
VIGLAVLLGCFLGWQFWLIWSLHAENAQLHAQVTHLTDQVCLYQRLVAQVVSGTAPVPCPPPGG